MKNNSSDFQDVRVKIDVYENLNPSKATWFDVNYIDIENFLESF